MPDSEETVIYQFKIVLLSISPMIWRRVLVKSDTIVSDLHHIIQLVMGWEDIHLHHFVIYGKQYGNRLAGAAIFTDRACEAKN